MRHFYYDTVLWVLSDESKKKKYLLSTHFQASSKIAFVIALFRFTLEGSLKRPPLLSLLPYPDDALFSHLNLCVTHWSSAEPVKVSNRHPDTQRQDHPGILLHLCREGSGEEGQPAPYHTWSKNGPHLGLGGEPALSCRYGPFASGFWWNILCRSWFSNKKCSTPQLGPSSSFRQSWVGLVLLWVSCLVEEGTGKGCGHLGSSAPWTARKRVIPSRGRSQTVVTPGGDKHLGPGGRPLLCRLIPAGRWHLFWATQAVQMSEEGPWGSTEPRRLLWRLLGPDLGIVYRAGHRGEREARSCLVLFTTLTGSSGRKELSSLCWVPRT